MKRKILLIDIRRRGQAMVEFALVLPLLLLLLFGILEVGRLIFTYASVVNASRQAVRYGSATGYESDTSSPLRYMDCPGIRAAAKNVSFGAGITDADIVINYFDPAGNKYPGCPPTNSALFDGGEIKTGSRIEVIVTGHWNSIVPGITGLSTRNLTSRSARTILSTIELRTNRGAISVSTSSSGVYNITIPSNTPTNTPTRTNTPIPTFTYTAGPSPTNTLTPTASNTPTASITPTASNTPTASLTVTPNDCPIRYAGKSMPTRNQFQVAFTNNGSTNATLTDISISYPHKPSTITLISVQPNLSTLLGVGNSITFTFTFSENFDASVTKDNFSGLLLTNLTICPTGISY